MTQTGGILPGDVFAIDLSPNEARLYNTHPDFTGTAALDVFAIVEDVLDGDYDADGDVDGADYIKWQQDFGMTGTGLDSDGNGDGSVDAADYTIWRNNFGAVTAASQSVSVPEPTTLTLLITLLALSAAERLFKS